MIQNRALNRSLTFANSLLDYCCHSLGSLENSEVKSSGTYIYQTILERGLKKKAGLGRKLNSDAGPKYPWPVPPELRSQSVSSK